MNSNYDIVLAYGQGGHEAEMRKLVEGLAPLDKGKILVLTDSLKLNSLADTQFSLPEIRDKHRNSIVTVVSRSLKLLKMLHGIKQNYSPKAVLSTGPGLSVITSIYFKFFCKAKVVHVETGCRFYSKSLTGMLMYYIADRFYVQNKEQLALYPKAIFSGRL
ncbi:PssD/Cps14F family polysaccharide biosynthesis glycosyltransferase [Aliagarivorans taiwanensis]|uniref:PssD/Cps14F family polysaccharide biosynthesis glycosyltransferase n=1 Tax=Aliagarivorans taiwanensis TaxID=561966 RepID=UPI000478EB33|nr:PssD/Cps14F family polysaccharide biosynthesis glycosyltransferase [Aliagarivorans taiwanensis]